MISINIYEYTYEKGDKIADILNPDVIPLMRREYNDKCFALGGLLKEALFGSGILATVITFKNGNAFNPEGLKVWDYLSGVYRTYTHHSVIYLGSCIMDVLHTDDLIATDEYIKQLKENNTNLRLMKSMTGCWYTDAGYETNITLPKLETNDWKD